MSQYYEENEGGKGRNGKNYYYCNERKWNGKTNYAILLELSASPFMNS